MEVALTSSVIPIWDPGLARLFAYWEKKRGTRAFPARADIDPLDFAYLLGNIILVDIRYEPLRFRIRLFGSNLADRLNYDMTGRDLDEHPSAEFRATIAQEWQKTVESRQITHTMIDRWMDERRVRYESLRLPLSSDGRIIDMLLVAIVHLDVQTRS